MSKASSHIQSMIDMGSVIKTYVSGQLYFSGLHDTPTDYQGHSGEYIVVNDNESGIHFTGIEKIATDLTDYGFLDGVGGGSSTTPQFCNVAGLSSTQDISHATSTKVNFDGDLTVGSQNWRTYNSDLGVNVIEPGEAGYYNINAGTRILSRNASEATQLNHVVAGSTSILKYNKTTQTGETIQVNVATKGDNYAWQVDSHVFKNNVYLEADDVIYCSAYMWKISNQSTPQRIDGVPSNTFLEVERSVVSSSDGSSTNSIILEATTTTNQTINQGTKTALTFDNVTKNTDSAYSTTTNVWTAPRDMEVLITAGCQFNYVEAGQMTGAYLIISDPDNPGRQYASSSDVTSSSSTSSRQFNATAVLSVTAGQKIQTEVIYYGNPSTWTLNTNKRFTIVEIGAGAAGGSSSATTTFDALTDTPVDYVNHSGEYLVVNDNESGIHFTGIEKIAQDLTDYGFIGGDGVTGFTGLDDTPTDYQGHSGEYLVVNDNESGIHFTGIEKIATDLTDYGFLDGVGGGSSITSYIDSVVTKTENEPIDKRSTDTTASSTNYYNVPVESLRFDDLEIGATYRISFRGRVKRTGSDAGCYIRVKNRLNSFTESIYTNLNPQEWADNESYPNPGDSVMELSSEGSSGYGDSIFESRIFEATGTHLDVLAHSVSQNSYFFHLRIQLEKITIGSQGGGSTGGGQIHAIFSESTGQVLTKSNNWDTYVDSISFPFGSWNGYARINYKNSFTKLPTVLATADHKYFGTNPHVFAQVQDQNVDRCDIVIGDTEGAQVQAKFNVVIFSDEIAGGGSSSTSTTNTQELTEQISQTIVDDNLIILDTDYSFQTKYLNGSISSDSNITDLEFTNLTIGDTYRLSSTVSINSDGTAGDKIKVNYYHDGNKIAAVYSDNISQSVSTSVLFNATSNSLLVSGQNLDANNYIEGNPNEITFTQVEKIISNMTAPEIISITDGSTQTFDGATMADNNYIKIEGENVSATIEIDGDSFVVAQSGDQMVWDQGGTGETALSLGDSINVTLSNSRVVEIKFYRSGSLYFAINKKTEPPIPSCVSSPVTITVESEYDSETSTSTFKYITSDSSDNGGLFGCIDVNRGETLTIFVTGDEPNLLSHPLKITHYNDLGQAMAPLSGVVKTDLTEGPYEDHTYSLTWEVPCDETIDKYQYQCENHAHMKGTINVFGVCPSTTPTPTPSITSTPSVTPSSTPAVTPTVTPTPSTSSVTQYFDTFPSSLPFVLR